MSDCSGGKVALVKLLGHGNWEKHFWVENGLIHWEQQRMSGELFNEIDDKFYIVYIGQQGLWAQGFGKTEQKWQFMGKQLEEFFLHNMQMMRIDAHVIRIGRYIRMANPNLDIGVPYILKCEPGSIANLLFDSTFKGSWLQTRSSAVVCRCQLPIFTEFGCV